MDISGPFQKSLLGSTIWIIIVDDFSRKKWSLFVNQKSKIGDATLSIIDKLIGLDKAPKFLRCDNAGENSKYLQELCIKKGIQLEFTAPNTPQQNGVAERAFAVLKNGAVAMLRGANLTNKWSGTLWAEAVNTKVHLHNRIPMSGEVQKNCSLE